VREAGSGAGRFFWGAGATLVAAAAAAVAVIYTNAWLGIRDLPAFFAATLPLALFLGLLSATLGRQELKLPNSARYALGIAMGAVFGFLWAVASALGLAHWLSEVHLPAMACWVGAGAAGLTSGLTLWSGRGKALELLLLCGLAVAIVACYEPVREALSGDQKLTVVFVRWWPAETSPPPADRRLAPAVKTALSASGVIGRIELAASAVYGRGRPALAVIALTGPLAGHMTIAIPDADTIVYVQRTHAFELVPENSPTLDRLLELFPDRQRPERVQYRIRLADGSEEGGLAASWDSAGARPKPHTSPRPREGLR